MLEKKKFLKKLSLEESYQVVQKSLIWDILYCPMILLSKFEDKNYRILLAEETQAFQTIYCTLKSKKWQYSKKKNRFSLKLGITDKYDPELPVVGFEKFVLNIYKRTIEKSEVILCQFCYENIPVPEKIGRGYSCPNCGAEYFSQYLECAGDSLRASIGLTQYLYPELREKEEIVIVKDYNQDKKGRINLYFLNYKFEQRKIKNGNN